MAIDIKFDLVGNPEPPTIILANRSGNKLGQLKVNVDSIDLSDKFNDASEISFTVNKYIDNELTPLWNKLVDFKLIYCKEWDLWFEAKVELDEETETVKTVFCTQLGQAELSQINLYNIEINTEADIERDDYKIAILYDKNNPKSSILNRLLEKAPHYSIVHVDSTIANIQRSFSFDGTSIYDAFKEIAEEIGCLFIYHSNSNDTNKNIINEQSLSLYKNLVDEQNKIEEWGLSEFGDAFDTKGNSFAQHKFGNVDMDNRNIIVWTDAIKNKYSNALSSWDYNPEVGSIDTVFGGSSRFGEGILDYGIEIAYTPIVNTDDEAIFVDMDTIYNYIEELVFDSTVDGVFSEETVLRLDKNGRNINGIFVQNVIAATDEGLNYDDNGNWAETVGRLMHFSGKYGAISLVHKDIAEYAESIGVSLEGFIYAHQNEGKNVINRTISVYDLQQYCNECGYRGEYTNVCPKCGSTNIRYGYGDDTRIFVTSDELATEGIELVTDTDAVKNCFKLEAGDDLMTATIRNCNPNGSDYIWYFSDMVKEDMSEDLVEKLNSYDSLYKEHYNNYESKLNVSLVNKYNALVKKYEGYYNTTSTCLSCDYEGVFEDACPKCDSKNILSGKNLQSIPTTIKGYSALMNAYYNTVDLALYLGSGLMPSIEMSETTAEEQANLLTASALSPVAVNTDNIKSVSLSTADSAVLSMAKIIVKSTYKVEVKTSTLSDNKVWEGSFIITNYSDENDTAESKTVKVVVNNDTETFVKQKIDKALIKEDTDDYSISGLFAKEYDDFCAELKKYALNPLKRFYDSCDACLNILIDQGAGDENKNPDLYEGLYEPYYKMSSAIAAEIKIREDEIAIIEGVWDKTNDDNPELVTKGLQQYITECSNKIQDILNFEKYLGETLWLEFCCYRRDDTYSNSNYVSDGLDNAQLFERALEFYEIAENEIYKSAELQHSISTSLNNLLAIDKFKPLVNSFSVGNWIRVQVDDRIFKLRLLEYEIDFGNFEGISVEFSDVTKIKNGITDMENVISQASSMATSYDSIQRQAGRGNEVKNTVEQWITDGLNTALVQLQNNDNEEVTMTKNGLLCKSFDDITGNYSSEQLKITHNIMAYTDDNWRTVKQAIGKHNYTVYSEDENKFVQKNGYGMSAEFVTAGIVSGSQIIGGDIYSDNYSVVDKTGSHLNLIDGTFSFGGGALRFEGGDLLISSPNVVTKNEVTQINEEYLKTTSVYAQNLKVNSAHINGTLTIGQLPSTVAETSDIPTKVSQLTNDKGYQTETGVTTIVNGVITTDYVNALNVTAGSVAAENITGTTISGKTITGGSLYSGDKNSAYYTEINDGTIKTYSLLFQNGSGASILFGGLGQYSESDYEFILLTRDASIADVSTLKEFRLNDGVLIDTFIADATKFELTGNVDISGNISASNFYGVYNEPTSDRDTKNAIDVFDDSYDRFFDELQPCHFKYNNDSSENVHFGFIAQDVESSMIKNDISASACLTKFEEPVNGGYYTISKPEFIALNTWQIQKSKTRIADLEEKVRELEMKFDNSASS